MAEKKVARTYCWCQDNLGDLIKKGGAMKFEKNVGKKEGVLRLVIGIVLLLLMIVVDGWLRWVSGLMGISLIATALAGT